MVRVGEACRHPRAGEAFFRQEDPAAQVGLVEVASGQTQMGAAEAAGLHHRREAAEAVGRHHRREAAEAADRHHHPVEEGRNPRRLRPVGARAAWEAPLWGLARLAWIGRCLGCVEAEARHQQEAAEVEVLQQRAGEGSHPLR